MSEALAELRGLKRPWRVLIIFSILVAVASYYVWNSLPESIKKDIFASLQNRNLSARQNNNTSTNESSVAPAVSGGPGTQSADTRQINRDPAGRQSAPPAGHMPSNPTRPAGDAAKPAPAAAADAIPTPGGSRDPRLINKISEARGYARGDAHARDTAVKVYHEAVGLLSKDDRARLNQALLRSAEADYRSMRYDEALRKYTALFAGFGRQE